ncbi:glycerate kinase isoform X2 [Lingula anatina]|nr:glycerate kinase isoform X2 [Lingula anatina]XP_013380002.1 glycerate kinase isoform X2 [Lingula anatina]|eukprot:XP_013380001.1 glycerate kinase isoform X2 [Lingula anatina]
MTSRTSGTGTTSYSNSQDVLKKDSLKIFKKAVKSVLPQNMVQNTLKVDERTLWVDGNEYALNKNVYMVGFGKAVLGMMQVAEELLGEHLVKGVASVPVGTQDKLQSGVEKSQIPREPSKIEIIEGAKDNLPDAEAHRAAQAICDMAQSLSHGDILLVMITGGGSALLPLPCAPITLEEVNETTKLMSKAGAKIQSMNTVRKNIEVLKGGGLARMAQPAKVISLILSDIVGDPLDMIASGPTVKDVSSAQQCLHLFADLDLVDKVPKSVLTFLQKGAANENSLKKGCSSTETNRFLSDDSVECDWNQVQNVIIGSNSIAIKAAVEKAEALGYVAFVLTDQLEGEARDIGVMFGKMAHFICESFKDKQQHMSSNKSLIKAEISLVQTGMTKEAVNSLRRAVSQAQNSGQPLCVICGGETTVSVKGQGQGGRNQEMAHSTAIELNMLFSDSPYKNDFNIQFLSVGTDGQDGPTDAAGAFADPMTLTLSADLDAVEFLNDNNSYNFFKQANNGQDLLVTGATGTNVMDLQFLLIKRCI